MLSRDLEIISAYFREVLKTAPYHEANIKNILSLIEEMKGGGDHDLGMSVLLSRDNTDECSICRKKVICYD